MKTSEMLKIRVTQKKQKNDESILGPIGKALTHRKTLRGQFLIKRVLPW